jgi:hypothetical protein
MNIRSLGSAFEPCQTQLYFLFGQRLLAQPGTLTDPRLFGPSGCLLAKKELLFVRCESVDFPVADQHAGDEDKVIERVPDPAQPALVAAAESGVQPPVPLAEYASRASNERFFIPSARSDRHARQDEPKFCGLRIGEASDLVDADRHEIIFVEITPCDLPTLDNQRIHCRFHLGSPHGSSRFEPKLGWHSAFPDETRFVLRLREPQSLQWSARCIQIYTHL